MTTVEQGQLNLFLIEHLAITGVTTSEKEDGTLLVSVPDVYEPSTLFIMNREEAKRFYELATEAGALSLSIETGDINATFTCFNVGKLSLPADAAEFAFLSQLGQTLISQVNIGRPPQQT